MKIKRRTLYFGLTLLNALLATTQAYKVIYDPSLGVAVHVAVMCYSVFAVGCCFTAGVFVEDD